MDENIESKVEIYKKYLEAEKEAKTNPARRICKLKPGCWLRIRNHILIFIAVFVGLYERALADNPLDSSLWLDFYEYTLGINLEDMSLDVITRASRYCPWIINIWSIYLCHMEQHGTSQEEVKGLHNCKR